MKPWQCRTCGGVRLPFHRCPPLTLSEPAPPVPPELIADIDAEMADMQQRIVRVAQERGFTLAPFGQFDAFAAQHAAGQQNAIAPAPDLMAKFMPSPTMPRLMALQRQNALLDGEGRIYPGTNCNHGTPGYALLFLEWEGLMRRTVYRTGPLPMDVYAQFALTPAGETARAEALAVKVQP